MEQIQETSLLFSQSPLCPLAADVIADGESIYFYLYDLDYKEQRLLARSACWVKNLKEAPESFNKEVIANDHQPMLPKQSVKDGADQHTAWVGEDLEIVWSKEGHIAALYHQGILYSVIPSWADGKNFSGYTRDVKDNSMVGWKLEDALEAMEPRIEEGKAFWQQEFNSVWQSYHTDYFKELCARFGEPLNCYDLHKDQFPSRLLMTFEKDAILYAFTVGVGMFSMPNADRYYDAYATHDRSEFAIALKKVAYTEEEQLTIYSSIAHLCELPWLQMDCLADQHTLNMPIGKYPYCMLLDDDQFPTPLDVSLKKQGVHITWLHPLTDDEYKDTQDEQRKATLLGKLIQESHTRA